MWLERGCLDTAWGLDVAAVPWLSCSWGAAGSNPGTAVGGKMLGPASSHPCFAGEGVPSSTQAYVKVELGKRAAAPGPPGAFLPLFLFLLLFLDRKFCGSQRNTIGSSHGREEGGHGGPTLACKDFWGSLSHGVCSFHKSLPSLSSFPQLLLLSVLSLETGSLGCTLHEVRVTAGTHPAHQPARLTRRPRSHCVGAGC